MAWLDGVLTHVKMEKKEKAMAARAASVPSFSGLSLGSETCHWLARIKGQIPGLGSRTESYRF